MPRAAASVGILCGVTRGAQFLVGFLMALLLTLAISTSLFFGSHAGSAFDDAFWPILGVAAGCGVVLLMLRRTRVCAAGVLCGAVASLVLQVGSLMILFFAGGGS
ncbi:hypothetical protein GCM10009844_22540 [Nocardioides koreensis]|uniref:Uncharacterized protein n=1 Tax=Nocardioides koreensis TaxID=433651 RepID=A0ABN2ZS33_9ACTN